MVTMATNVELGGYVLAPYKAVHYFAEVVAIDMDGKIRVFTVAFLSPDTNFPPVAMVSLADLRVPYRLIAASHNREMEKKIKAIPKARQPGIAINVSEMVYARVMPGAAYEPAFVDIRDSTHKLDMYGVRIKRTGESKGLCRSDLVPMKLGPVAQLNARREEDHPKIRNPKSITLTTRDTSLANTRGVAFSGLPPIPSQAGPAAARWKDLLTPHLLDLDTGCDAAVKAKLVLSGAAEPKYGKHGWKAGEVGLLIADDKVKEHEAFWWNGDKSGRNKPHNTDDISNSSM